MEMKNPMDEKKYEIVEIQVDADVLEELKTVIAPLGLTPEMLIVRFFELSLPLHAWPRSLHGRRYPA